jgi:monooxygenase
MTFCQYKAMTIDWRGGREKFKGVLFGTQHWPDKLDYRGKKVITIGSGATAVTLVPAMPDTAGHITRSLLNV